MRDLPNLYYKDGSIWKELSLSSDVEPVLLWTGRWENRYSTIPQIPSIINYDEVGLVVNEIGYIVAYKVVDNTNVIEAPYTYNWSGTGSSIYNMSNMSMFYTLYICGFGCNADGTLHGTYNYGSREMPAISMGYNGSYVEDGMYLGNGRIRAIYGLHKEKK